ncbi:MAG TPA: hypothetical protein VHX12_13260, partial [Acidisoma sp.]|nr:hypothetical protein [Acidisoma sp.]
MVSLPGPNGLLARLNENEKLLSAYNRATYAVEPDRNITPASEWILDNFYLVEEQIQMARRHLPRRYSRELPRLAAGRSAGLPRVYDIVLGFVSHVDAQLDMEQIASFLSAYQVVTPLKLGELWAVPIMIRLALIESLRRITDRLSVARTDRDAADKWALRLVSTAENQPSQVVMVVADMAKSDLSMTSSFVAEFCQRIARSSAPVPLARSWIEQRLAEEHMTIEQLVRADSQRQAADQVSISNAITGLRMLGAWDWRTFVESASIVDRILRTDPADVYRQMDFQTRDAYRHAVEEQARHFASGESDIAERAVHLAEQGARAHGREDRTAHVGYYLLARGRPSLERGLRAHRPIRVELERAILRHPTAFYIGGVAILTALITFAAFLASRNLWHGNGLLAALALPAVIAFSQLAVATVNWISTILTDPRLLARLDYSAGIPPESRTIVVVPSLVGDIPSVERLLEAIEIHYLANRDPNLLLALLTDFTDSHSETEADDEKIRGRLKAGIEELNARYAPKESSPFYLFHR